MKYLIFLAFAMFPKEELPDVWFSAKTVDDTIDMEFTFNKELYSEEEALQLMQEFIDVRMSKLGYEKI